MKLLEFQKRIVYSLIFPDYNPPEDDKDEGDEDTEEEEMEGIGVEEDPEINLNLLPPRMNRNDYSARLDGGFMRVSK